MSQMVHAVQCPRHISRWFITGMDSCPIYKTSLTSPRAYCGLLCCRSAQILQYYLYIWFLLLTTSTVSHTKCFLNDFQSVCAGNLGNMPLIIIPAVCKEKGSPFGSPDTCQTYGLAYVSLSMAVIQYFIST